MKTIEIKDITDSYQQERILYNQKIINQYGKDIKQTPYASKILNFNSYQRLISMMIELENGTVREVRFGITDQGTFSTTFPETTTKEMPPLEQLNICDRIDTFFRVHKKEFIEGKDILEITMNDKNNLLKYSFQDSGITNSKKTTLSKILKRNL